MLDITGARWSLKGAEAILKLWSLKSSGNFNDYWLFHKKAIEPKNLRVAIFKKASIQRNYTQMHSTRVGLDKRESHK